MNPELLNLFKQELKQCLREVLKEEYIPEQININNKQEEKPISRKEAAEFLRVSTVTLDRYRRLDYIEAEQCVGKPVRYLKSKLLLNKKRKKR